MNIKELRIKTISQLKNICKEKNITKFSKLRKNELIDIIYNHSDKNKNKSKNILEKSTIDNKYTKNILLKRFNIHLQYYKDMKETAIECGIDFRSPSIPEDISENIIKFILRLNSDVTSNWNREKDLISETEGIQECKCFTSNGPISFTPVSEWDCIYFLDARNWSNKKFKLYKFPYKKTSEEWKNIKVNKTETFQDQCDQKRRPRINWESLYFQIKDRCTLVFDDSLENILKL